ncbi:MAG TPA: PH domain-containing protein [Gaiellaceae bacterium]|nr:PH domain-containing protein [Gaiellaceae bacterium]
MQHTYGVVWRRGVRPLARGRLELGPHALRFEGTDASAAQLVEEISYEDIANVHVGRKLTERIDGHRTVVLDRADGDPIAIAGVAEPGAIGELADRLAMLQRSSVRRRAAIVAPLQPGAAEAVRGLLADGPPFAPEELGCERHAVYVTDDEAVFVFEWRGAESVEALLGKAAFWEKAAAWQPHLAGPPRVAEPAYSWARHAPGDPALLPPGLHPEPQ